jgi:hypothetical protein
MSERGKSIRKGRKYLKDDVGTWGIKKLEGICFPQQRICGWLS